MNEKLLKMPQWTTGSRLLKLGQQIKFYFFLPIGMSADDLVIFPKYLERANPGEKFTAGGDLEWLETLESERVGLDFQNGRATVTYQPQRPGNYIARWGAAGESFYRYFSVIEDDWIVVRFSSFLELEPNPTLHGAGVPLDYRLPIDRFDENDPLFERFRENHRRFGDAIAAVLPDTPLARSEATMTSDHRELLYGQMLDKVRSLLPDANDARTARSRCGTT